MKLRTGLLKVAVTTSLGLNLPYFWKGFFFYRLIKGRRVEDQRAQTHIIPRTCH